MKSFLSNCSLSAWLTKVIDALRKQRGVQVIQVTYTAPPVNEVTQITSDWDYRPRGEIRPKVALDCEGEGTPDVVGPSTPNENDNVWFNFTNAEKTIETPQ